MLPELKKIDKRLDNVELVCAKTDGAKYDFNCFSLPLKFIAKIHNYQITLNGAIKKQAELKELITKLNNDYDPRNLQVSARNVSDTRDETIDFFEIGIFLYKGNLFKKKKEKEELEENFFLKYIKNEKGINYELFEKHFSFTVPTALVKNYLKQEIKRRITT